MDLSGLIVPGVILALIIGCGALASWAWRAPRVRAADIDQAERTTMSEVGRDVHVVAPTQPGLDDLPLRADPRRESAQTEFGG